MAVKVHLHAGSIAGAGKSRAHHWSQGSGQKARGQAARGHKVKHMLPNANQNSADLCNICFARRLHCKLFPLCDLYCTAWTHKCQAMQHGHLALCRKGMPLKRMLAVCKEHLTAQSSMHLANSKLPDLCRFASMGVRAACLSQARESRRVLRRLLSRTASSRRWWSFSTMARFNAASALAASAACSFSYSGFRCRISESLAAFEMTAQLCGH